MKIMIKTSMKLLLRTKAFWFFLILTPILSTIVLRSEFDSSAAYIQKDNGEIIELSGADDKVAYNGGNGEYLVKVYDACGGEASEEILKNHRAMEVDSKLMPFKDIIRLIDEL